MADKKISFIIITYNRKQDLKPCVLSVMNQLWPPDEIIIIDNNSADGTDRMFAQDPALQNPIIKYIKLDKNIGVAGGRNYGIEIAKGDIVVFVDDDAVLEPRNATQLIAEKFENNSQIGILAFKIVNYYSKNIQREEFPHLDKSLSPDKEFETSYYVGAGHAVKKELFYRCGTYPEDFFYGFEELDMSFRVIDEGFKILYFPEVLVWHKKAPAGRLSNEKKWLHVYRNRLVIAYKYLYAWHFAVSSLVWFMVTLKLSKNLIIPILGFRTFLKDRKHIKKHPISKKTLNRLRKLRGRIWY